MSDPGIPVLESLLVFADGKVALEYPLAVYRPDEFLSGRSVRVILITKIENSFLGCVPQAAWDRLVAKRILPRTFFSKAVRVLVKNCREDDRSSVGDSDSVVWLGFVASDMEALVEPSTMEDENVEVDFGEDQLPFAEALVQIAQDHFAFFSAEEEAPGPEAEEHGSENLAERMRHMEIMMQNLSAHMASLVPTTLKDAFAEASCSNSKSTAHCKDKAEDAQGVGSGPGRGEVPRFGCRRGSGCNASRNRTWSPGRNAGLDGEESQRCESSEESKNGSSGCRPPIRERGGRSRRAWISGWLLRSRWCSIAQAHGDCWGNQERPEEEVWKFKAGDCLRWSYGGAWWRVLLIPRRKEVSSGEEAVALHSSRCSRRDLPPHRTAYGRRCALPQLAAGVGSSYVHGPRMGRTSVQDRTVQGSGTLRMGCVGDLRPAEEGKHRWCKSSLLLAPFTIRPSIGRSWKLGPLIRPFSGGFASFQQLISTPGASGGERRSSVQQTFRPTLGGTRPQPPQRPRRLRHSEAKPGEEGSRRSRRRRSCSSKESRQVQGQSKGCPGGRRPLSPCIHACPTQSDGLVPDDGPSPSTMLLPGEKASTVVISAVVNSFFRWTLKTKGVFRKFLLSVIAMPKGEIRSPTSKRDGGVHLPVWPMPVPYPEVFTKKVDSDGGWKKIVLCMQVLALSWLHLGEPEAAPREIKIGNALTPQQWSVVNMLRHLSFDSNTPEFVDAALMARAAAKFESMEEVMGSLHRSLNSFECSLYSGDRFFKHEDFDDSWMRSGSLVGKLSGAKMTGAKPIIASRLEFPGPPIAKFHKCRE